MHVFVLESLLLLLFLSLLLREVDSNKVGEVLLALQRFLDQLSCIFVLCGDEHTDGEFRERSDVFNVKVFVFYF